MDTVALARELGRAIQNEEVYKKLHKVQAEADADEKLQELISTFNLKRVAINVESQKADKDQDKLTALNKEMREAYSDIMSNENMIAYNEAKQELEALTNQVNFIIQQSIDGADPDAVEYDASCTGNCGTCGGCG